MLSKPGLDVFAVSARTTLAPRRRAITLRTAQESDIPGRRVSAGALPLKQAPP